MSKKVLVIGGNIEGVQAALDLAECGIEVALVEESDALRLNSQGEEQANKRGEMLPYMPKLLKAASHPNINVLTGARVRRVRGEKGDFKIRIARQPRYVNLDICTSCGKCELECPVNIAPLPGDSQDGHKAIHRPYFGLKSVPSAYSVDKKGVSSCTAACPAGINAHGYVALIAQGKFAEALDIITESVPFPRVLGRICNRPCEAKCVRGEIDKPIAICALKRFVADNNSTESSLKRAHPNNGIKLGGPPRVAIIGAGPAGLTAARDLARLGHRSTVFEALPVPGGMITVGMPRFRLPREVRQADIDDIIRLGIEIKTSTPIGKDLTLDDLKRQGYKAILIAVGAHRNQKLGVQGEGLAGVIDSIALLQSLNLKQPITVGSRVIVIGGGYTGIDSARTAVRLHCKKVLVVDRYAREDLSANTEEIAEAEEEGVKFEYLVAPVRIIGRAGKVAGVEFRRMRPVEQEAGGRRPTVPIEGSEFIVEADTVVVAAGQRPDLSFLEGDATLTEGRKHIVVDPVTQVANIPGIFAAGDAARECGPMINAIGAGRRAAISIDKYLRGEEIVREHTLGKITPVEVKLEEVFVPPIEPQKMPSLPFKDRTGNFEEVELGFNQEMAISEAKRCLNCAVCSSCLECERACELEAVDHNLKPERLNLEAAAIVTSETLVAEGADKLKGATEESQPTIITERPGIHFIKSSSPSDALYNASAIAARVMVDMAEYRRISRDGHNTSQETGIGKTAGQLNVAMTPRIGVFVCGCGGGISGVIDIPEVIRHCREVNDVAYCGDIGYACTVEGAGEIKSMAEQYGLTHVVVAACSCCNLDQICFSCSDRRISCKSNLLDGSESAGIYYEFVNIREHCAWVHENEPAKATAKSESLIRAGIARAREGQLLPARVINIEPSVLVVGAGPGGMQAASYIAEQGFQTTLMRFNGQVKPQSENGPSKQSPSQQLLESELLKNGATIISDAELVCVDGTPGRYRVIMAQSGKTSSLTAGTIIFDVNHGPSEDKKELPPLLQRIFRNGNSPKADELPVLEPAVSRLPGVFLCGIGEALPDAPEALIQGAAAASKASIFLNKGLIDIKQTVVAVDRQRCRGCGTCVTVCPFEAILLEEKSSGVFISEVDEGLCRGCGICVAHCPSGALSQNGCTDGQIIASLEAVLS